LDTNPKSNLHWEMEAKEASRSEESSNSERETQAGIGSVNRTMATHSVPTVVKNRTHTAGKRKAIHPISKSAVNPSDLMRRILTEDVFLGMLCLERKRAERSRKKLLLLLLDSEEATDAGRKEEVLKGVVKAADEARRETDPAGWYKRNSILGIIFTELGTLDDATISEKLLKKVHKALVAHLSAEDFEKVRVSVHIFAADPGDQGPHISENPAFYPDLLHMQDSKRAALVVKRFMDIAGSIAALIVFSPLFVLIAVIIKLTSKGPILFKQERLEQFGKTFTCLKFRSMYANNDLKIHQEFMKRVISGKHDGNSNGGVKPSYKMTNDPRITKIGKLLRRTSLDELPQFLNVLKGDMSLVGPRPPLAYEYEEYDVWHRRRVLEIKPGITGLWQVKGRSRVRFDDMVRLDLQYARGWSLWLDIQILMQTPRAVLFGDGAY
jgi:exopolysaccharide biosynthesis polyprenyl glycosylphosphotransferase